jgi:hypothetical protein
MGISSPVVRDFVALDVRVLCWLTVKSQGIGLKGCLASRHMHTLRAFTPIRRELGLGSLHFIPRDAVLVESPHSFFGRKTKVPLSPKMNRPPIRRILGRIIVAPSAGATGCQFFRWNNRGDPGYHRITGTSPVGTAGVAGGPPRGRCFPYTGDPGQRPGRASGGTGTCDFSASAQGCAGAP